MAINLFKHNQDAYTAALQMLRTTGNAAVIHPTGTGKSFIAFKLCEDHPEKTICWLSPSSYIFETQPEDPWNAKFRLVQQYYEVHGYTNMPADYVVESVWLRRWISEQKARLNDKPTGRSKTAKTLTPEQIQQLSTVGIKPQKAALEIA